MQNAPHSPTTASFIAYHARMGRRLAVETEGGGVTYADLAMHIELACRYLTHHGLRQKDLLVVGLADPYAHLVFVLAAEQLGLLSCSIQMSEDVLPEDVMAGARMVITQEGDSPVACAHHQLLAHWRELAIDMAPPPAIALQDTDPVRLVRSSGTTGTPKKIVIRRDRQARWLAYLAVSAGYGPQTRFFVAAVFPVNTFYMRAVLCLRMGGCLLMGRIVQLSRATHTWMLPSTLEQVIDDLPLGFVKPSNLEISTAGAALANATRMRVCDALATRIVNVYGSNEVGPICTMTDDGRGIVVPGTDVQVVDENDQEVPLGTPGELRARNAIMADSYFDHAQATAERFKQGWFYPGDEAVMLSPGVLRLIGRTDDMLNFSGFKRRPEEVEELLKGVRGVRDAAALTEPNREGVVLLYIGLVLDDGLTIEDVTPALRSVLKLPVKGMLVRHLSALPRTSTGKLRRKALMPFFVDQSASKS